MAKTMTPYTVLDENLTQMQEYFKNQENQLKRTMLTDREYSSQIDRLQKEYDLNKSNIVSHRQRLDMIKKFTNEGLVSPDQAEKAMWSTVLPNEAMRAMYPPVKEEKFETLFSPSQLQSHLGPMVDFAVSAEQRPGKYKTILGIPQLLGGKKEGPRTQGSLLQQYITWRQQIAYDSMSSTKQRQLDQQWDALMRNGITDREGETILPPNNEWNPQSTEVQAWRQKGPLIKAARKFITPFGTSILAGKKEKEIESGSTVLAKKKVSQPAIYAKNKAGKRIVSTDGGETWQSTK